MIDREIYCPTREAWDREASSPHKKVLPHTPEVALSLASYCAREKDARSWSGAYLISRCLDDAVRPCCVCLCGIVRLSSDRDSSPLVLSSVRAHLVLVKIFIQSLLVASTRNERCCRNSRVLLIDVMSQLTILFSPSEQGWTSFGQPRRLRKRHISLRPRVTGEVKHSVSSRPWRRPS